MKQRSCYMQLAVLVFVFMIFMITAHFVDHSPNTWYATLKKPSLTPPDWIFGPVWTLLYISMVIAIFLVWNAPFSPLSFIASIFFWSQLFVNFIWSFIFFHHHAISLALVDIALLLVLIGGTMFSFYRMKQKIALWLFSPYFLWVTFALVLNYQIWILNR